MQPALRRLRVGSAPRHPLLRFLIRRALLGLLALWVVSLLVFGATEALPGDAALLKLTRDQTPEALKALREQLHLDEPLVSQYWHWLRDTVSGDLGNSLASDVPVSTIIGDRVGNTLALTLAAALISFPLGLSLGIWAAMRRDSVVDHASSAALLTVTAVPEFVIGIGLILLLATNVLSIFPAVSSLDPGQSPLSQLDLLVLPALTLGMAISPYIARMIRASMIEVLESDYVAMARLKGLREWRVILRHALINASGPTIQVSAIALAYLAGGVVVVESVFGYPGLGSALVSAVQSRDIPVVQAVTVLFGIVYITVNVAADALTILVTPKLRTATRWAR